MKSGRTNSRADKGTLRRILLLLLPFLGYAGVSFAQTAQNYREQATELARAKSWDEAIAAYRKSLELEPKDSLTHYNLGFKLDRKSTRLNSSHSQISYAVFCLKKKKKI